VTVTVWRSESTTPHRVHEGVVQVSRYVDGIDLYNRDGLLAAYGPEHCWSIETEGEKP